MSDYVRVAALSGLAEGSACRVVVGGVAVCLARSEGEVFALADVCSHEEVPLSEGEVEDGTIECWLHGSRFDLRTGTPTGLPATRPVTTFPVKTEGDDIFVAVEEL
ncbi:MAG: non-heme iron oxygenase ferredoxin subunit [Mycobacteriales bacterium]